MALTLLAWLIAIPLLGGLTGLRTMMPITVLCWFSWLGHLSVHGTWAAWTSSGISVIVFTILAAGELIGDKLPTTPARTAAFPLIARIVFGTLVGAIAALGLGGSPLEGALLGGISAVAGAFLGFHLRQWLVRENNCRDWLIASAEDGITILLAVLAMGIVTG
jgi:uncharacterized membrane protein